MYGTEFTINLTATFAINTKVWTFLKKAVVYSLTSAAGQNFMISNKNLIPVAGKTVHASQRYILDNYL